MNISTAVKYIFYTVPILLLSVYDFSYVTYDSEPDYVISVFNIVQYGLPSHSLHPGILSQYILSIPAAIGIYFGLSIDVLIILMRLVELSFFSIIVVISLGYIKVLDKEDTIFYYLFVWLLIVLYPTTSEMFRYITGEVLLFGFSFLLSALWFRFLNVGKGILLLSFILGAALNAKISFLLLLVVLVVYHMLHYIYYKKTIQGLIQISKILLLGILWFLLFSLPRIFQILRNIQETLGDRIMEMISIISDFSILSYVIFIVVLLLLSVFYFSIKIKWLLIDKYYILSKYIKNGWFVGIPVLVFLMYKYIYYLYVSDITYLSNLNKFEDVAIIRRNSVALYAFIVFLILNTIIKNEILTKITYNSIKSRTVILLLGFVFVAHASSSKEFMFGKTQSNFDSRVMEIKSIEKNPSLYIHRDNYFDSVIQFYMWAYIRHGRCTSSLFDSVYRKSFPDINLDNITYILDSHTLKCSEKNYADSGTRSFLEYWRKIPSNITVTPSCDSLELDKNINKIYLIHKKYVDESSYDILVNSLRKSISVCEYKLIVNDVYTDDKIAVYNVIKK